MPASNPQDIARKVREGRPASLYYFYGHDTGALESFVKRLTARLLPASARAMNRRSISAVRALSSATFSVAVIGKSNPHFAKEIAESLSARSSFCSRG